MKKNKKRSDDFVTGTLDEEFAVRTGFSTTGKISNKEQESLYDCADTKRAVKYMEGFVRSHGRSFFFVDYVQNRIVKDVNKPATVAYLEEVIPYMSFTGEALEKFTKNAPLHLLGLYAYHNPIPNKVKSLWEKRGIAV